MEAMAPVLGTLPPGTHVCFVQQDDEILLYNVTKAFELTAGRQPTAMIDVAEQARQISPRTEDPPPEDRMLIDPEHARTVDLSYPLLLLQTGDETRGQGRIIDGWHRIYRASQLGIAELPAIVVTAEEEPLIRIDPGMKGESGHVVTVRPAATGDAAALAELRFRFAEESNRRGRQSFDDFVAHFSRYVCDALASGRWQAVVAEIEGRVVGHAYLEMIDKLPVPGRPYRRMGYITNVYVEPDLRNGGVGAQIVDEVIRLGREMKLESLVLWPTQRSIPFYRRLGFEPTNALELDFRS
jgi:GNAT superfamily N-acetyltransferase